jgi:hypothetical protein
VPLDRSRPFGIGMTEPRQRASVRDVSNIAKSCVAKRCVAMRLVAIMIAASLGWLCAALAQDAQPPNPPLLADAVNAVVGAWEFSNADRDKICRFNFRADPVPGGYKLDIDKNCPNLFPSTKDITAWSVDTYGSLKLLDARGNAVLEFAEVESGMYDGFQPDEGRFVLQSAAAAPVRSADDMVGEWAIARGTGKPICALTLANTTAGGDNLVLKIKPGCDALVTRFNPVTWRMNNGELIFSSARGQTWRFEENDANTWQRVPETPDPVLLVRQ